MNVAPATCTRKQSVRMDARFARRREIACVVTSGGMPAFSIKISRDETKKSSQQSANP